MKVTRIKDLIETEREVLFGEGISMRPVLESDGMGFSIHKTIIPKGSKGHWHYKHHLESCYCIEGLGVLTNLENHEEYIIEPDTVYSLDKNDDHTFEALEDVVLISVFNPPVIGNEIHNEDGSYAPSPLIKKKAREIVQTALCCQNVYDATDLVTEILKK